MAATATTPTASNKTEALQAPEIEASGPIMDGFRDATVAEKIGEDVEAEEDEDKSLITRGFEQMTSFNRLVTGGVTLAVGILVYNEVISALPDSGGAINQSGVTSTVESAFQLAPVALIVIIAAVILAQVMGFRQNG